MGGTLQAFFRNKVFGSKLPLVLEVCLDKDLISQQLTVNSCGPLLWPPLQKAQASKPGALCKPVASQWPSGNKTGDLITALQQCSWWWPYERLKDSLPTKAHGVSSADSNLWAKQPKSSWASHVWEAATGAKAPSKRGESSWTLICLSPLLLTERPLANSQWVLIAWLETRLWRLQEWMWLIMSVFTQGYGWLHVLPKFSRPCLLLPGVPSTNSHTRSSLRNRAMSHPLWKEHFVERSVFNTFQLKGIIEYDI